MAEDPSKRSNVKKTLRPQDFKVVVRGFTEKGRLWPAAMLTTQVNLINRMCECRRLRFKHIKLIRQEGVTEPEPLELLHFASVNHKKESSFFDALCVPHVDPTICPVWWTAAQLVGMHGTMPGILQSIIAEDMVDVPAIDFNTGAPTHKRQPRWWWYALYPAGGSSDGKDPMRETISVQAAWKELRAELDKIPEEFRPINCWHAARSLGLDYAQEFGLSSGQQDIRGCWEGAEANTRTKAYMTNLELRDACLRMSGHVPKNGELPREHYVRANHWAGVRAALVEAGFIREVEALEQAIFPGLGDAIAAVTERHRQIDAGTYQGPANLDKEGRPEKDDNAMPFLRALEYLRGAFLAGAWAILEMRGPEANAQLPCFRHPVFLQEHMSLSEEQPSWFMGRLCVAAKKDASLRMEERLDRGRTAKEYAEKNRQEMRQLFQQFARGRKGVDTSAVVAAASAAPPPPEQPLIYLPAGGPKVVQWPPKIKSMEMLWSVWDMDFRGHCYPGTSDIDPAKARWPTQDKKPGSAFNSYYRAAVLYMDRLVHLEQHRSIGVVAPHAQAAAVVVRQLEDARTECIVTAAQLCEAVHSLGNPRNTKQTVGEKKFPISKIADALTKAPRWLALPAAAVA